MSWGLDIVTKDADGNDLWVEIVSGHTGNLSPMWREALPFFQVSKDLDGLKCEDILLELQIGVADATLNEEKYRALNPSNGWGDYEGFYEILTKTFELCRKHPSGTLVWNG